MATVVTVTTVKLFLSSAPIVRGSSTFNTSVIPVPPSAVKFANHEDEAVRDLVKWANALSQRLQELLDQ